MPQYQAEARRGGTVWVIRDLVNQRDLLGEYESRDVAMRHADVMNSSDPEGLRNREKIEAANGQLVPVGLREPPPKLRDPKTSALDGKTNPTDEYEIFEDADGYGVLNKTQEYKFQVRFAKRDGALRQWFGLTRFRISRGDEFVLKVLARFKLDAATQAQDLRCGIPGVLDLFKLYADKDDQDPDLAQQVLDENQADRARVFLNRLARRGLVEQVKGENLLTWKIVDAGREWMALCHDYERLRRTAEPKLVKA